MFGLLEAEACGSKGGDLRRISVRDMLDQIGLLSCVEEFFLRYINLLRKTQPKCVKYPTLGPEVQMSKQRQWSFCMSVFILTVYSVLIWSYKSLAWCACLL